MASVRMSEKFAARWAAGPVDSVQRRGDVKRGDRVRLMSVYLDPETGEMVTPVVRLVDAAPGGWWGMPDSDSDVCALAPVTRSGLVLVEVRKPAPGSQFRFSGPGVPSRAGMPGAYEPVVNPCEACGAADTDGRWVLDAARGVEVFRRLCVGCVLPAPVEALDAAAGAAARAADAAAVRARATDGAGERRRLAAEADRLGREAARLAGLAAVVSAAPVEPAAPVVPWVSMVDAVARVRAAGLSGGWDEAAALLVDARVASNLTTVETLNRVLSSLAAGPVEPVEAAPVARWCSPRLPAGAYAGAPVDGVRRFGGGESERCDWCGDWVDALRRVRPFVGGVESSLRLEMCGDCFGDVYLRGGALPVGRDGERFRPLVGEAETVEVAQADAPAPMVEAAGVVMVHRAVEVVGSVSGVRLTREQKKAANRALAAAMRAQGFTPSGEQWEKAKAGTLEGFVAVGAAAVAVGR